MNIRDYTEIYDKPGTDRMDYFPFADVQSGKKVDVM